jgi:hypothetical protein
MPSIFIEVRGAERFGDGLNSLQREIPKMMKAQMYRAAYLIGAVFQVYPSKPSNSTYIRTGRLRDSVKINDIGTGYGVSIDPVSPRGVRYGRYVVGDMMGGGQARALSHWPTLRKVADSKTETMFNNTESQLQADIRERGLS